MRITNKMMTNNSLYNINNNKNLLSKLENQYSSGKKISRPSDDPIIAVRALKFRTNLTEAEQYVDKNIPDALNWMEVTEAALKTINGLIENMNTYCNQGANDYLTAEDRNSIVINLNQYEQQIYQEGNTNYAGRYVFSGFKTDTSLVFTAEENNYSYRIVEPLKPEKLEIISVMSNPVDITKLDLNDLATWDTTVPSIKDVYRLPLGYDKLDGNEPASMSFVDKDGNTISSDNGDFIINTVSVNDEDAYDAPDNQINYIYETGELIIGKDLYKELQKAQSISVDYTKKTFTQNDLRPEHYYDCVRTTQDTGRITEFHKEDQDINYEVNFNQRLTINTQGSDAFSTAIHRLVSEISDSIRAVQAVEDQMSEVDKMLADSKMSEPQLKKLKEIKEQLESEYTLRTSQMTDAFQRGLTITEKEQENTNVCVADLGGRYKRLLLTQDRLESQTVDFEELLSDNEDVNMVDTIVKYTSANNVFNASLAAASKLVQSSLLDYLS
ncbi:MAG: flagellar hook-associated protein FlgL [Lachnospiraceae bacterium]|nr:flagellar hook-associated protein FlgL [Lachnospiraceae bacterium]